MRILLLGGTAQAVEVLKALTNYSVLYSSLTKYGAEIVERDFNVETMHGALDECLFKEIIEQKKIELILDVTHPFAEEISRLAIRISKQLNIPYIRYEEERPQVNEDKIRKIAEGKDIVPGFLLKKFPSQKEAAQYLENQRGKILLTTGSNHLKIWVDLRDRLIVRVLPKGEVLEKCAYLGFQPCQIIAEQGPFTLEENLAQINRYHCEILVTKVGWKHSGYLEKLIAAYISGLECLVIEPPEIFYPRQVTNVDELKRELRRLDGEAKRIMLQGTGSSVGKSLLSAALCRILYQDGYNVRPFKSQNMALNSFITEDGKEMGRAQVTQAECAGKKPDVRMNPILLKPNSDNGSQVIINGEVWKNLKAKDYYSNKEQLLNIVLKDYRELASESEILVIEGAGSPAEINLRENDIVNMGLAEMIDAPVILVCDIDKGGMFASLYGTIMLLSEEERKRIKGYIINKFRGDVKLLQPGIDMIGELIKIPCLGVMPYIQINIDDEDSITNRFKKKEPDHSFTIGVIRLKHFSNTSDFTVFHTYKDINVEYYNSLQELERAKPNVLIIPGSKNTIDDMYLLRESKMADEIIKKAEEVPIVGICGGFQMMGKIIEDPYGVEGELDQIEGLGLLNVSTRLNNRKETRQVRAKTRIGDSPITGYEIHMGETVLDESVKPFSRFENGTFDGAWSSDGRHFGTYIHGLFDNDSYREIFLQTLGYNDKAKHKYKEYKENQYNLLAQRVRENINIDQIYKIINES